MNRVGLGTFPLAGVFNSISKDAAKDLVRFFIDQGGYYIDTAPMYGFGEVESLLGELLSEYKRDQFFLVTKCGYIDVENKTFQTIQKSGKYDDVIRECDISLKRLGLDYIDLYLLHSPDPATPTEETMSAMAELKKQGKVKSIGVSNVSLAELKEYEKTAHVEYIQNRFSLINRSVDEAFASYLIDNSIGFMPYQVIDRGQLTGKVLEDLGNLREGDLRVGRSDWKPETFNVIADWVGKEISPLAKDLGLTIGQLSIAWALYQQFMSFVIVGATTSKYIPINLKANDVVLTKETVAQIDRAYKTLEDTIQHDFGMSVREFRGLNEKYY